MDRYITISLLRRGGTVAILRRFKRGELEPHINSMGRVLMIASSNGVLDDQISGVKLIDNEVEYTAMVTSGFISAYKRDFQNELTDYMLMDDYLEKWRGWVYKQPHIMLQSVEQIAIVRAENTQSVSQMLATLEDLVPHMENKMPTNAQDFRDVVCALHTVILRLKETTNLATECLEWRNAFKTAAGLKAESEQLATELRKLDERRQTITARQSAVVVAQNELNINQRRLAEFGTTK